MKIINQASGMNIKIIILALSVALLFINADCNKMEEMPSPVTCQIEGKLVESCNSSLPIKNYSFSFPVASTENSNGYHKTITTDSNGYFKFSYIYNSSQAQFTLFKFMVDSLKTKYLLRNIPTGKNLNLGNIPFNFTVPVKVKFANFKSISASDSVYVYLFGASSFFKSQYIKGPLNSDILGAFELKETPCFQNIDSSFTFGVRLYQNKNTVPIKEIKYPITPCGITQEVVF